MAAGPNSTLRRRLAIVLWGAAAFAIAWYSGRRVAGPPATTIRIYDLRDLLIDAPNFDNAPLLGIGSTRGQSKNQPTTSANSQSAVRTPGAADSREAKIAQIIRTIRSTVEPSSWQNGVGIISELRGRLVITQTPAAHEQIQTLLRDLYAAAQVQVTVEVQFIWLDRDAASTLPPALRARLSETQFDSPAEDLELTANDVNSLLGAAQSSQGRIAMKYPRMTLFNGQRAYVLTSTQRAYVQSVVESRDSNGKTTRTTKTDVANSGAILDVQASVSPDHQWVTLSLQPQMAQLVSLQSAAGQGQVQNPIVDFATMATTVRVHDGKTILLAGFSTTMRSSTTAPTLPPGSTRKLFLLVKPTVILPKTDPNAGVFPRPAP